LKQIEHFSLSKPVYESLKSMISSRELKPGEKLIQEKIAKQLGVSRTPLMKAMQMLENEFLIESIPRKGMFVRDFSIEEMIEVYYCRESIECLAVRLATWRSDKKDILALFQLFNPFTESKGEIDIEEYRLADEKFHNSIIELSKNPVLKKMSKLSQVLSRVYSLGLLRAPEDTIAEHVNIIDAMAAGDAKQAESLMNDHIRLSMELLQNMSKEEKSK